MQLQDVLTTDGHLFLGSRLKRLAERMQGDVVRVAQDVGLPVQPGQYPLLATLDRHGPQTTAELTKAMRLSQPTITRAVTRLVDMGLVEVSRIRRDQRHKTLSLTKDGEAAIARAKLLLWPRIDAAVRDLLDGCEGPLLDQIASIEQALDIRSLDKRALAHAGGPLQIREFDDALAVDFRDINVQWIEAMYRVEATDREVLDHPRERIIDPGGTILFVEAAGLGIVGTCALQRTGERRFELTKMGVLESARGLKVGEFLLRAVIARAQEMDVELLYLLSNRKSAAAIHLYEKLGFRHDDGIMREFGVRYQRCDVAMRYEDPA